MKYVLDSKYLDISHLEDNDNVVIFNEKNDKIVTLSNHELDIIKKYEEFNNIKACYLYFKDQFELDSDEIIFKIISSAKKMDLLVLNDEVDDSYTNYLSFKFNALLLWISPLIKVKFNAIKKNSIFQLLSVTLSDKWFFPMAFFLFAGALAMLFVINAMATESTSMFFSNFILLIPFVLFSTILHELGHLIMYKTLDGKGGKIGGGLLFYVYPIMYCTNLLIIYHKKWEKIIISSAGIIVDIFLFFGMLYFNFDPFYVLLTVYRTLFNINPLVGKTDGFYITKDLLGFEPLYFIKRRSWLFVQHLRKFSFKWDYFIDFLILSLILFINIVFYLSIIFMYWIPDVIEFFI